MPPTRTLPAIALLAGTVALPAGRAQPPAADVVLVLKGHTDTVAAVAVSPDGTRIATASFDKTVKLWDAETGEGLRTFGGEKGHAGQVLAVAFSPKGDQLATGGADNKALVWSTSADAPVKTFPHPNLVDAVAFDDTGTVLATGCHDGVLRTFDVPKGAQRKQANAHVQTAPQQQAHPIYAVAWSPNFKQILTTSFDRSAKLWDAAQLTPVREFKPAPDPAALDKPAAKKDEKQETKAEKKDEPPPGPPFGHRDQVFAAAFTADGKFVVTGSSDRAVKLWDVATGRVVREFPSPDLKPVLPNEPAPSHPGWVHAVRVTPDGKFVVSAGPAPRGRGYLAVWSAEDGKRVYGAELDAGPVHGLAVTPDGTRLVLGCGPQSRTQTDAEVLIIKLPER